ncbi:MAG: hypothetical protein A3F67_00575 [Verrucomicrobia bacterium RIFCSPHIGHO2_12_FULL_41_10]|nr:MAG: hypothetical protein A3F67_00575 [Verrucomicrobia bacterium RIFCSPHIGHO2_12_FULL_41_10]HLB34186.1 hypothetical protein [Chthoniobacterales bacterium]
MKTIFSIGIAGLTFFASTELYAEDAQIRLKDQRQNGQLSSVGLSAQLGFMPQLMMNLATLGETEQAVEKLIVGETAAVQPASLKKLRGHQEEEYLGLKHGFLTESSERLREARIVSPVTEFSHLENTVGEESIAASLLSPTTTDVVASCDQHQKASSTACIEEQKESEIDNELLPPLTLKDFRGAVVAYPEAARLILVEEGKSVSIQAQDDEPGDADRNNCENKKIIDALKKIIPLGVADDFLQYNNTTFDSDIKPLTGERLRNIIEGLDQKSITLTRGTDLLQEEALTQFSPYFDSIRKEAGIVTGLRGRGNRIIEAVKSADKQRTDRDILIIQHEKEFNESEWAKAVAHKEKAEAAIAQVKQLNNNEIINKAIAIESQARQATEEAAKEVARKKGIYEVAADNEAKAVAEVAQKKSHMAATAEILKSALDNLSQVSSGERVAAQKAVDIAIKVDSQAIKDANEAAVQAAKHHDFAKDAKQRSDAAAAKAITMEEAFNKAQANTDQVLISVCSINERIIRAKSDKTQADKALKTLEETRAALPFWNLPAKDKADQAIITAKEKIARTTKVLDEEIARSQRLASLTSFNECTPSKAIKMDLTKNEADEVVSEAQKEIDRTSKAISIKEEKSEREADQAEVDTLAKSTKIFDFNSIREEMGVVTSLRGRGSRVIEVMKSLDKQRASRNALIIQQEKECNESEWMKAVAHKEKAETASVKVNQLMNNEIVNKAIALESQAKQAADEAANDAAKKMSVYEVAAANEAKAAAEVALKKSYMEATAESLKIATNKLSQVSPVELASAQAAVDLTTKKASLAMKDTEEATAKAAKHRDFAKEAKLRADIATVKAKTMLDAFKKAQADVDQSLTSSCTIAERVTTAEAERAEADKTLKELEESKAVVPFWNLAAKSKIDQTIVVAKEEIARTTKVLNEEIARAERLAHFTSLTELTQFKDAKIEVLKTNREAQDTEIRAKKIAEVNRLASLTDAEKEAEAKADEAVNAELKAKKAFEVAVDEAFRMADIYTEATEAAVKKSTRASIKMSNALANNAEIEAAKTVTKATTKEIYAAKAKEDFDLASEREADMAEAYIYAESAADRAVFFVGSSVNRVTMAEIAKIEALHAFQVAQNHRDSLSVLNFSARTEVEKYVEVAQKEFDRTTIAAQCEVERRKREVARATVDDIAKNAKAANLLKVEVEAAEAKISKNVIEGKDVTTAAVSAAVYANAAAEKAIAKKALMTAMELTESIQHKEAIRVVSLTQTQKEVERINAEAGKAEMEVRKKAAIVQKIANDTSILYNQVLIHKTDAIHQVQNTIQEADGTIAAQVASFGASVASVGSSGSLDPVSLAFLGVGKAVQGGASLFIMQKKQEASQAVNNRANVTRAIIAAQTAKVLAVQDAIAQKEAIHAIQIMSDAASRLICPEARRAALSLAMVSITKLDAVVKIIKAELNEACEEVTLAEISKNEVPFWNTTALIEADKVIKRAYSKVVSFTRISQILESHLTNALEVIESKKERDNRITQDIESILDQAKENLKTARAARNSKSNEITESAWEHAAEAVFAGWSEVLEVKKIMLLISPEIDKTYLIQEIQQAETQKSLAVAEVSWAKAYVALLDANVTKAIRKEVFQELTEAQWSEASQTAARYWLIAIEAKKAALALVSEEDNSSLTIEIKEAEFIRAKLVADIAEANASMLSHTYKSIKNDKYTTDFTRQRTAFLTAAAWEETVKLKKEALAIASKEESIELTIDVCKAEVRKGEFEDEAARAKRG